MTHRVEHISEGVTIHLCDWRDVLPTLGHQGVAIVSDPPYGMDWSTDSTRFSGGGPKGRASQGKGKADWPTIQGDSDPFDPSPFLTFAEVVLWGANHFAQRLPLGRTLVWIKKEPKLFRSFLSDAEIGWARGGHGVFCHDKPFPNLTRIREAGASAEAGGAGAHPTQKPIALMEWCIEKYARKSPLIVDPFMGSGTTGVAAIRQGRRFVGCEIEPVYFETALRRLSVAASQVALFKPPPPDEAAGVCQEALAL